MRTVALVLALCVAAPAWGAPSKAEQAAALFARGQKLYRAGDYRAAIASFEAAHKHAAHYANLFNIARCYENLGETAKAIAFYDQAKVGAPPSERSDIDARLARLRKTPTKLFVASQPAGAKVTVDGRAKPESRSTPLMVRLVPGAHVLLVRHAGHLLEAKRVVVKAGVSRTVNVKLRRRPTMSKCVHAKPCPKSPAPLVDARTLRLHFIVGPIVGLTKGRPLAPGLGGRVYATIRRVLFGAHVGLFPVGEEQVSVTSPQGDNYNRARFNSIQTQVDVGYVFPFGNAKLEAFAGFGLNYDRVNFSSDQPKPDGKFPPESVREGFAFVWSVGGNIEAMFTRWMSVSLLVRGGVIHGDRFNKSGSSADLETTSGSFPYLSVLGGVGFHL